MSNVLEQFHPNFTPGWVLLEDYVLDSINGRTFLWKRCIYCRNFGKCPQVENRNTQELLALSGLKRLMDSQQDGHHLVVPRNWVSKFLTSSVREFIYPIADYYKGQQSYIRRITVRQHPDWHHPFTPNGHGKHVCQCGYIDPTSENGIRDRDELWRERQKAEKRMHAFLYLARRIDRDRELQPLLNIRPFGDGWIRRISRQQCRHWNQALSMIIPE